MRKIDKIVVHCSATPEDRDVPMSEIRKWHVQERGWSDIGYHYVVLLDGTLEIGRPMHRNGAHVKGHNKNSIGIAYVGGTAATGQPKDTRTEQQKFTLEALLKTLRSIYPEAKIYGHRDFSSKACPSFDAKEEYKNL